MAFKPRNYLKKPFRKFHSRNELFKQRFSAANLTIFGIVFAAAGGYIIYSSFAAPTPTVANVWVDQDGGTCVRSATPVPYDTNTACGNDVSCVINVECGAFDDAWDKASSGDIIVVKAGTYKTQMINGDKTSETKIMGEGDGDDVIIRNSGTGCMNLYGTGSAVCAQAAYMTLENMVLDTHSEFDANSAIRIWGGNGCDTGCGGVTYSAHHVTLRNVDFWGTYPNMQVNAPDFTWQGGSHGQDGVVYPKICAGGSEPVWLESGADRATFDGVRFNPKLTETNGCDPHIETIRLQGDPDDVTIKNSWFVAGSDACSGHIFTGAGTSSNNIRIVNNVFGALNCGGPLHQASGTCDWYWAYNTFLHHGVGGGCSGANTSIWIGNVGVTGTQHCSGTHLNNMWQGSSNTTACSGADRVVTSLGVDAGGKLQAGSVLIDAITDGTASSFCSTADNPSTPSVEGLGGKDFESTNRPQGAACDAGADEFGPPSNITANIWVDTNGGSCVRKATADVYVDGEACGSLGAAYNVAGVGDKIFIKSGTYTSGQSISFRSALASGSPVTIEPATEETVSFTSNIGVDAGNITLKGPNFNVRSFDVGNSGGSSTRRSNITFDNLNVDANGPNNLNTDAIWVGNTQNFTVKNSRVGNTMAGQGPSDTAKSVMTCAGNSTCHNINMVFENNLFYNADTGNNSQAHLECIWAGGVQGFILRKNTFRGCTYFDVFVTVVLVNNQPQPKDHIFEDNLFGQTIHPNEHDFGFGVSMHGDVAPDGFRFNRNTFEGYMTTHLDVGPVQNGWQMTGNIFAKGVSISETDTDVGCHPGITYAYNVMTHSCGSNATVASASAIRSGWVSPSTNKNTPDDFHLLATSPAINAGSPAHAGTLDFDGLSRGNPPDAGALEFGGTAPPPTPTVSISANPTSVPSGTTTTLTWSSNNTTSCTASGGWSGSKATSGTQASPVITSNTTFTLTCTNGSQSANASTTVTTTAAQLSCSGSAAAVCEDFNSSASNFNTIGGTWGISAGKYNLTSPTPASTVTKMFYNKALHTTNMSSGTDFTLTFDGSVVDCCNAYNDFGAVWGYQDENNYYYANFSESNDGFTSGIYKIQDGNQTELADITSVITSGTTYAMKVERQGNTYRVYRNSTLLATATDNTFTSGRLGVGTRDDTASFDNFIVTTASAGPKQGDINGDNAVNITDLSFLLSSYGQNTTTCATNNSYTCDLSSPADNTVNIFDLSILLSRYGT